MKVSKVIEVLTDNYNPDDQIAITWWDKHWADSMLDTTLADRLWNRIVSDIDTNGYLEEAGGREMLSALIELVREYRD